MRNIILVAWDGLRYDHCSIYGYERKTTPFLDLIAKQGWIFNQAISHSYWSLPSHYSVCTGKYPYEHGALMENTKLDGTVTPLPNQPLLAETLKGMGYSTWSYMDGSWVTDRSGLSRGFDHFYEYTLFRDPPIEGWGGRLLNKLFDTFEPQEPFFLWVGTRDNHVPFNVPKEFEVYAKSRRLETRPDQYYTGSVIWGEEECQEAKDRYDEGVHYQDHNLNLLWAWLEEKGYLEDTAFIFYGDHGEAMCDRWMGDRYLFEHTCVFYDELLHVPLIVWAPDLAPQQIDCQVELKKIYNIVLDLAGHKESDPADYHSPYAISQASYPKIISYIWKQSNPEYDSPYIFSEKVSVRTSEWKYIHTKRWGEELYDLTADPKERENIFNPNSPEVKVAKAQLEDITCK